MYGLSDVSVSVENLNSLVPSYLGYARSLARAILTGTWRPKQDACRALVEIFAFVFELEKKGADVHLVCDIGWKHCHFLDTFVFCTTLAVLDEWVLFRIDAHVDFAHYTTFFNDHLALHLLFVILSYVSFLW